MNELIKIPMLEWQRDYLDDQNRFKFTAASRQSGKSHVGALEDVLDSLPRKNLSVILSAGERQSLEVMEKVRMHTQAMGAAVDVQDDFFKDTSLLQHTATFANGSRIIALPANPDTARGYSGNVRLDEFGIHKDSRAIWAALVPTVTRGYKLRVTSTFKGTENEFYKLGKMLGLVDGLRPEKQPVLVNGWTGHWVSIYMVAEQAARCPELGLKIDPEELRRAIDDEEIWAQEFLNVPMSGAECYIPLDLVLACESELASLEWDGRSRPGLSAGWDFARKRDGSVIFLGDPEADLVVVRGAKWLNQMTFTQQAKVGAEVAERVQECGGRFCIDATGIGAQIAEQLHEKFTCVEAVEFGARVETGAKTEEGKKVSVPVKERMATEMKRRFEEHSLRLPESPRIRRGVQAVKRFVGPTGQIRFDAARTEQGHADEFWGLALLVAALTGARNHVPASEGGLMGDSVMRGLVGKEF